MSVINQLYTGLSSSSGIVYDNSDSGLQSDIVKDAIDELARLHTVSEYDMVLYADKWNTDFVPNRYQIDLPGVDEYSVIQLHMSPRANKLQRDMVSDAVIDGGVQSNGSFTLYAYGTVPTEDVPINIVISNANLVSEYFNMSRALYHNGSGVIPLQAAIDNFSNNNIIINPGFAINSNNESIYTGSYSQQPECVDCWKILNHGTTVEKTNTGITVKNISSSETNVMSQRIYVTDDMVGEKLTLSYNVLSVSGTSHIQVLDNNGSMIAISPALESGINCVVSNSVIPDKCEYIDIIISVSGVDNNLSLRWIKLELGTIVTKYIPRPYATELLLCKNYMGTDRDSVVSLTNVTIPVSKFIVDDTNENYAYKADIICDGITENHYATVTFSADDALSGIFAPICNTSANTITIYASKCPTANVVINTITCTKVISKEVM